MKDNRLELEGHPNSVAGTSALVANWSACVQQLISGADVDDDALYDLHCRDMIDQRLAAGLPLGKRAAAQLKEADRRFLAYVERTDQCVWPGATAQEGGWTPEHHWWFFFQLPKNS